MPGVIDPEVMNIDELPGIWTPVQWDMDEEERLAELEQQATASLLNTIDAPEAILRLLLDEIEIERIFDPPKGYDPEIQGEWDPELVTFHFKRAVKMFSVRRERDYLRAEYDVEDLGRWVFEIEPEAVSIQRI